MFWLKINQPQQLKKDVLCRMLTHGIVCPNIRDIFTAGGQDSISWKGKVYHNIPQILIKLTSLLTEINSIIGELSLEELGLYWKIDISNPYHSWIDLVTENLAHLKLKINIRAYLTETIIG